MVIMRRHSLTKPGVYFVVLNRWVNVTYTVTTVNFPNTFQKMSATFGNDLCTQKGQKLKKGKT